MAFMALQAPGDDSAHLIYEFERRAYPVRNSLLTIGRDAASHILIREPAVSRNHADGATIAFGRRQGRSWLCDSHVHDQTTPVGRRGH
jgi:hypothetical protein